MSNTLTKKHAEMYGGNLKTLHKVQSATVTGTAAPAAAYSYLCLPIAKKITVKNVRFAVDNTAGADGTSTHCSVGVYKGTLNAIATASTTGGGDKTGLTAVATKTIAAADIAKTTVFNLTLSTTAADLNLDGSSTAPVGLCFYATSPNDSNTFPKGSWIVEFYDRDEAP